MAITEDQLPEIVTEIPVWEQDLQKVGFVRRIFRARKWYGADWWFVAISAIMVVGFIILALIPAPFAPYNPHEIVGSSFLAPGKTPPIPLLVVPQGSPVE